ncbi:DNA-binding transcriptional regulator, GntR family [Formivibrio citricus]|uniref:DNA-binding transcriptional regulator, GntR family n=1 Tax=Formivibrio citricus TaxID=83765 RepID=A0A1I4V2R9_9NEIS|nr:GntR family transcriptional regulator [Formivibrio citricus]SFM95421.1 DNA-binding transcriptional regulator, GntR family [Formivibrio citricus]
MPRILAPQLALQIIDYIRSRHLPAGSHLGTQFLADQFKVSRAPVLAALKQLAQEGVVVAERNRGFFLARDASLIVPPAKTLEESAEDSLYYQLAEDRLAGKLEERVSENELMRCYEVPRATLRNVLLRAADDLWMERLPGHGWRFLPVLTSQQAYEEGYRFRAAIEPLALLEPGFRVNPVALQALRAQQQALLDGEIDTLSRTQLFERNSEFHEVLTGFSNNAFFLDAVKKVNRVRRLLDYRSTLDRSRLPQQCREHLLILDMLESGRIVEASERLRIHVQGALASKRDLVSVLR